VFSNKFAIDGVQRDRVSDGGVGPAFGHGAVVSDRLFLRGHRR